jgi:O-antigen/teichoic acid export membrane protein
MFQRFRQYFTNSGLLRNSATLIIGTVFAQLIPILFQPLLRRMFTAEEFGTAALYVTAVGMFVAIANLKYESAIVLPEEDQEANHLVAGGVLITALIALILWLLIFLNQSWIVQRFSLANEEAWYLHLLPLSVFLVSSFQCFNLYLIRKKAFKDAARNKVYRRTTEAAAQSASGYFGSSTGLLFGNLVGDIINFFGGFWQAKRLGLNFAFRLQNILPTLQKYWRFPIYHAFPSLLNTISLTLPVFIVNAAFGKAQTGQFDLSRMVLSLPMALISISLSQVYLQHQAERIRKQEAIVPDFKKVSLTLLLLSLPLAIFLLFFASPLFAFVFGPEWRLAGQLTGVLIFGQTLKFVVSPLSSTLVALQEVRFSALWQILYFAAMLWLYVQPGQNIQDFVWRYCLVDLLAYSCYYGLIYNRVKHYENSRA